MRKTNNKTTGKAKRLIMAAALFILSVSQAWAYDFSVVVPSGHTLYFYISSSNTVNVVWPNSNATDIANIYDGYTEPTGNLVIPSTVTYNGTTYTVTSMGTAFANCEGLTSVTIPNTVTYIALNAFRNCTGLTSVTLSTSLNYLGERVFQGCTNLSSVNIPNNVDTIRNYAFYGCSGLTSVTIGNSVTSIGNYAFYGCSGLTSVTIPNSVTSIGSSAFRFCSGLTSVTIPNSVTTIGYEAFYNCTGLTSVTIPNSVTSIGSYAFSGCSGLTSVTIGNSVTSIGNYAFIGCSGLTSVTIPNSVTSIGSSAFYNCSGLTSVTIPNSVTTIGYEAFYNCTGLTSVTIPNSVTSIGEHAFGACSGLTTLNFNAINCGDFSTPYPPFHNTPISTIDIGDSVQRIPDYFAYGLGFVTSITIPNSVTTIGYGAFANSTGLTSVTIPNSVTSIGGWAFYNCSGLTSVTIPNSVTTIGYEAFYNCTGLTSVTIPNSVTSIGSYAFSGCSGLTSVTIPNSVTSIEGSTFAYCSGLTSVTIPNSVTTIGRSAFRGCSGLTSVTIPNSVTTIGEHAFGACSGLTSVTIPNSVTSIGDSAFIGCSGLTSVTIPNSVTTIRSSAFSYCSGLTSFTIPNSVTSIGNAAFYGTAYYNDVSNWTNNVLYKDNCLLEVSSDFSTSSYSIQSNTRVIADRAFSNCSGLTSVTIPNSVTSIGEYAFGNCSSIGRIDLKSVTPPSISSNSFQGVSSAIPVYIPCGSLSNYSSSSWDSRFGNLQESQVFSLGVAVNDSTMGMALILSNTCANTAIQAYPYDGYNFVGWSDGSTMNPRVVTLTQDTVFTAIFEANIQSHTITVMSANNSMGTVSGGGTYEHGTIIMLTATPSPGYNFVSWNDGNTDNPRTITVTEDATYIASFAEGDAQTYTITAMSANNSMGTVSGGGTYPEGTLVTLTATPIGNYVFVGWNDGNTDNPRTITVTEDATYIASFAEEDAQTYTITVLSANNSMGTVSGGGTYEEGTQATITATPAENHHFVSWNDGNTDNPRTITVTGDAVYIASFAENVSIDAANELDALTFYPNPTSGTITFSSTDIRKVEVMDAMGRMVATFENSNIIDLSKLSKGYYTMRITTDNGVTIRKVIRN